MAGRCAAVAGRRAPRGTIVGAAAGRGVPRRLGRQTRRCAVAATGRRNRRATRRVPPARRCHRSRPGSQGGPRCGSPVGAAAPLAGADGSGGRGPHAARFRAQQRRDRQRAVHLAEDRQRPRVPHPRQARRPDQGGGGYRGSPTATGLRGVIGKTYDRWATGVLRRSLLRRAITPTSGGITMHGKRSLAAVTGIGVSIGACLAAGPAAARWTFHDEAATQVIAPPGGTDGQACSEGVRALSGWLVAEDPDTFVPDQNSGAYDAVTYQVWRAPDGFFTFGGD